MTQWGTQLNCDSCVRDWTGLCPHFASAVLTTCVKSETAVTWCGEFYFKQYLCLLLQAHSTFPSSHVFSSELGDKGQEVGLKTLYYLVKEQHSKWRTGNKVVVSRRAEGLSLGWIWEVGLLFSSVCAKAFALSTWPIYLQCTSAEFSLCLGTWHEDISCVQISVFRVSAGRPKAEKWARAEIAFKAQIENMCELSDSLEPKSWIVSLQLPTAYFFSTFCR